MPNSRSLATLLLVLFFAGGLAACNGSSSSTKATSGISTPGKVSSVPSS